MEKILAYDCDDEEIEEFRILRFPFSSDIPYWDEEPNFDPRFYCAIKGNDGNSYAISVYSDYSEYYYKKQENKAKIHELPSVVLPISEMQYYEVAYDGKTQQKWYYDRDRNKLKQELESILKNSKLSTKKLINRRKEN